MREDEPIELNLGVSPRIKRDGIALLLATIATVSLLLALSNVLPWLEGRLNGGVSGLLLNVVALLIWASFAGWLLVRILRRLRDGTMRQRFLWVSLLLIVLLPWAISIIQVDATTAFHLGFSRWAADNLDVAPIRQWYSTHPVASTQPAPAPLWWPTREYEEPVGVPVPPSSWPSSLGRVKPDEVRILADGSGLILAWQGGPASWGRMVFISGPNTNPPAELATNPMQWRVSRDGVQVGVIEHH